MGLTNKLSELLKVGEIKDMVIRLVEAKFELKKLEIQEKLEQMAADAVYWALFLILGAVASVFILILAAWGFNQWLGEPWGYVIILAMALLVMGIMYGASDRVKQQIKEGIQKRMDELEN